MSPRTEAGRLLLERLEWSAQRHEVEPSSALDLAERSVDAIEAEARAQGYREALEEVRAGVEGLPLAKALSDMNYRAVLALLDRLSKGTDG